MSGCHEHKDNVQGDINKGGMGVWCRKRVNKGGMRATMGQRRKEVRRENGRQVRGGGREEEGIHQNKKGRLEMKEREGGESRSDEK